MTEPLAGKPLRYLIGADEDNLPTVGPNEIIEVPYNAAKPRVGIAIGYCNLFDEEDTGKLGPYLHTSDTAEEYNEGQIDPRGAGWLKNLNAQFALRKKQGFQYIELDNPDAYKWPDVKRAIDLAAGYGLRVIAKNPGLCDGMDAYVKHPNVFGVIVELGAGNPASMDKLRKVNGRPDLPVWFVAFDRRSKAGGWNWINAIAPKARELGMGATYSLRSEYGNVVDVVKPNPVSQR